MSAPPLLHWPDSCDSPRYRARPRAASSAGSCLGQLLEERHEGGLRPCARSSAQASHQAPARVIQRAKDGALVVVAAAGNPHRLSAPAPDLCQRRDECGSRIRPRRPNGVVQIGLVRTQQAFFPSQSSTRLAAATASRVLAVAQIMARTTIAIAQGMHAPDAAYRR